MHGDELDGVRKVNWVSNTEALIEGVFDFDEVESLLLDKLKKMAYENIEEKDRNEACIRPNRELETFFDAYKYLDDYYKVIIQFRLVMKGKDVEVVEDGVKKIKTQGIAQMKLGCGFIIDFYRKQEAGDLAKFFVGAYHRYFGESQFSYSAIYCALDRNAFIRYFRKIAGGKIVA